MDVTFKGFQLEAGDGISLPEFAEVLAKASSSSVQIKFHDHGRLFLFEKESDSEFYTGLLITVKDQKSFCQLQNDGGKFKIKISELEKGSQMMDFNYFVLHKKTFCGIYQHYNASCSPLQFCFFLRKNFWTPEAKARTEVKVAELLGKGTPLEKASKQAAKLFKKLLKFDLFYKEDDFNTIAKNLKQIKAFKYGISTAMVPEDGFVPQGVGLKRITSAVIFENKNAVEQIVGSISELVQKLGITQGKLVGVDPDGEEQAINLEKNVEGFGSYDFDAMTKEIELDLENFAKSGIIKKLLQAAKDNKALFCVP